jgi:hypothetical protein
MRGAFDETDAIFRASAPKVDRIEDRSSNRAAAETGEPTAACRRAEPSQI